MENYRVAIISVIVKDLNSVGQLNDILHDYHDYIIGRMGIPYKQKSVNIISIAIDAPEDVINALSGKIGTLNGICTKTAYSDVICKQF